MEHCISVFQKEQEDRLFRVYVTDALKVIADNTMRFAGGATMGSRFYDMVYKKQPMKDKEETADEIILRIKGKVEGVRDG